MNSQNFDVEQMRKIWLEMGNALGMEMPPKDPDNLNKMRTSLDRIRDRYRLGCDWSIVGAIVFAAFFFFMPSLKDEYRIPLAITYVMVMLANAYALYWLWRGTGKINPLTMSITRVSSMAKYYKKCHLLYIMIGFPVAALWIVFFMYATDRSESIIIGSIMGGIFGLYGLRQYLNDYRNLSK
ncbi:MAG: hypothetical protein K2H38_06485 [Muribaculaceae bacterium]|nr:hypothetical protein [Muribaculaceae bacterium]